MAESYSVKARLSAVDDGFSSTLKRATGAVSSLASKIGGGIGFGVLTGIGQQAFSALTSGASDLVSGINDSNVAWKTFESNMGIIGKGAKEIDGVKKELQDFAQETVYSASDMASTYAQLAAVGTKNTTQLVKGFGGLAAAAENPQQAMKTLSQQATQMAAKPSVQWADFKLMLEQTPAGMAAVAKAMGMTTSELVTAVQEGKVETADFFNTIARVGGDANGEFYKMATEAKSIGQAMDGLKETLGNKLTPAFDILSKIGIKAIEGISSKLGKLDGEAIAAKVSGWIKKVQPMWNSFQKAVSKVWAVVSGVGQKLAPIFESLKEKAGSAVQGLLDKIGSIDANAIVEKVSGWIQKAQPYFDLFSSAIQTVANAISAAIPYVVSFASAIGGFLLDNAETICNAIKIATPIVLGLVGAFKGYKIISTLVPGMTSFAKSIASMASQGLSGLATKLFGVAGGQTAAGTAAGASATKLLASGAAFLMIGAGVLLAAGGFALLAQASIALANAGGGAIAVMVGMVATMALLAVGAAALGPALTAGSAGFIAFGVAIALVGAGALLAGAALAIVASVLPTIVTYGAQSAEIIAQLGAGMIMFAAGATLAGAGAIVLGAGLAVAAVGTAAFGAAMIVAAGGTVVLLAAISGVKASMKAIASSAKSAEKSLKSMNKSVDAVESGLDGLGSMAKSAMKKLTSAFDDTAKKAEKAGKKVGTGFTEGMQSGLAKAPTVAKTTTATVTNALMAGRTPAYNAGAYIGQGFANGMLSCLATIEAAAERMAAAADKAVRAKARIASPSKVSMKLGSYWGEGFANGISDMARDAWNAAESLVAIPNMAMPNLALPYGGEMSTDYNYNRSADYSFEIPVTLDGKVIAKATAKYTQEELGKTLTRESRKNGVR